MKKVVLMGGVVVVVLGLLWLFSTVSKNDGGDGSDAIVTDIAAAGDPIDAVMDFYDTWHAAVLSTTTDPVNQGLLTDDRLTTAAQERLANADMTLDPVLCQPSVPPRIGARIISNNNGVAEVQVLARGLEVKSSRFANVAVAVVGDQWKINNITCEDAAAPLTEREFTFERTGQLLMDVPEPLDSRYWYLVFVEDTQPAFAALVINDQTQCLVNGASVACDTSQFNDTDTVQVQGNMTESGVSVTRLERP